jgi:uncharacterized protein
VPDRFEAALLASRNAARSAMLAVMVEVVAFDKAGVRGFLHRPQGRAGTGENGLVLTHGAGGNCNSPVVTRAAEAFCAAGLCVLRVDLPFRQRRPRGPPSRSSAAADRAGLQQAVCQMHDVVPGAVFLGGHSYGGRQATLLAAADAAIAAGLLLLSYPLHAPGRHDQPRIEHFPRLRLPAVFVHGTKDPFGSIDEMRAAITAIPALVRVIVIDGAGHDLRRGNFDAVPLVQALTGG